MRWRWKLIKRGTSTFSGSGQGDRGGMVSRRSIPFIVQHKKMTRNHTVGGTRCAWTKRSLPERFTLSQTKLLPLSFALQKVVIITGHGWLAKRGLQVPCWPPFRFSHSTSFPRLPHKRKRTKSHFNPLEMGGNAAYRLELQVIPSHPSRDNKANRTCRPGRS